MKNGSNEFIASAVQSQEQSTKLLEKLMAVAKPETVYGAPVTVGDQTVITASEVTVGMGIGFGSGSGPVRQRGADEGADGEAPRWVAAEAVAVAAWPPAGRWQSSPFALTGSR